MWDMIFPVRNGIKPNMKVGRNFNNETLKYATKAKVADLIVKEIIKRMRDQKFMVIEGNGGIGGMTTSLLSNPRISAVMSFERNPQRRLWLKRNITAYNYGDKAIVPDIDEVGLTGDENFKDYKGSVFVFDPPWLPEDYKGGEDYKKYYILKDMKLGKYSLEEWLDKLKDTAYMVVYHLPPGYMLRGVPGWSYEIKKISDKQKVRASVYYCYNSRLTGVGKKTKFNGVVDFDEIVTALDDAPNDGGFGILKDLYSECLKTNGAVSGCNVFVKYGFVDPEPFLEQYRDGVVEPYVSDEKFKKMKEKDAPVSVSLKTGKETKVTETTKEEKIGKIKKRILKELEDLPKPKKMYEEDSPEWMADLQNFVYQFLKKFLSDENSKKLVSSENMVYWNMVFTHESVDFDDNYETYEKLGDQVLKTNTYEYIYHYGRDNNIKITADNLTNFNKYYGSKVFLKEIGIGEIFYPWLRITPLAETDKQSVNIKEDLVEALFGVLYEIGNATKYGAGSFLAHKLFEFIFTGFSISEVDLAKESKTDFEQIFERIGLKDHKPKLISVGLNEYRGEYKYKLELDDEAYKFLKEYFPSIERVITDATGSSKKDTESKLYDKAMKLYKNIGITINWADEIKIKDFINELKENDPVIYKKLYSKLVRENYWDGRKYRFERITNVVVQGKYKIWQLIGKVETTDTKGNVTEKNNILGEGKGDSDSEAKMNAVKNYLSKL